VNPVNLLPAKHRPRTPTGGQQGSAYVVVGVLGALLVLVLFYVLTVNGVNSRKNQVARAKAATAELQAQAGELSAYGDFVAIKDQRVSSVKQLADGRIDWERLTRGLARLLPNQVWLISANASASGDPSVAGTSGGGSSSGSPAAPAAPGTVAGPKVALSGCAPSHSAVAVTLVRLRELPGATDVALTDITRPEPVQAPAPTTGGTGPAPAPAASGDSDCGSVNGKPAAKWDATVSFDAKASTAGKGVPRSLGGGS
jgi:Tfp pilus assembly protein PilN